MSLRHDGQDSKVVIPNEVSIVLEEQQTLKTPIKMKTRLFFAALLLLAFGTVKAQNEADQINIIRVLGSGDVVVRPIVIEERWQIGH